MRDTLEAGKDLVVIECEKLLTIPGVGADPVAAEIVRGAMPSARASSNVIAPRASRRVLKIRTRSPSLGRPKPGCTA
jgi:hypothetical protein